MHATVLGPVRRFFALFLIGSVLVGVLAPGAVAMSRTDIQQAAGQEGLSSDVQDFLNGVLEDAMLRAALVAPATQSTSQTLRTTHERAPLFVIAAATLEVTEGHDVPSWSPQPVVASSPYVLASGRTGPNPPRAP